MYGGEEKHREHDARACCQRISEVHCPYAGYGATASCPDIPVAERWSERWSTSSLESQCGETQYTKGKQSWGERCESFSAQAGRHHRGLHLQVMVTS